MVTFSHHVFVDKMDTGIGLALIQFMQAEAANFKYLMHLSVTTILRFSSHLN